MTTDTERALWRLEHIQEAVSRIRIVLQNKGLEDLRSDFLIRAAYERLIEIISEASRHIPAAWKAEYSDVPWQQVHGIGNILRHVYHTVEPAVLWNICETGLDPLERAVNGMIETYGPIL